MEKRQQSFEHVMREMHERQQHMGRDYDLETLMKSQIEDAVDFFGARAGTIFIREGDKLNFGYVVNRDVPQDRRDFMYANALPIGNTSIAGRVANEGKPLVIRDAYKIDYFNKSFDEKSGFRTESVMSVPIKSRDGINIGVFMLINKNLDGKVVGFLKNDLLAAQILASGYIKGDIEKGQSNRDAIKNTLIMANMFDTSETASHTERVGEYSRVLFEEWAKLDRLSNQEISRFIDPLRLGAPLHDVGKIQIPMEILKKPGKLTDDERAIIQTHTSLGEDYIRQRFSLLYPWSYMAADIAGSHHQRWNGKGYPIKNDENGKPREISGNEIPLSGRIVAVADVYDALRTRRCYKDAIPHEKTREMIISESGSHFDPSLVVAFNNVHNVFNKIRERYSDTLK